MQGGTHSAARFRTCARLACFARRNTGMASFSGMSTRRLAHRHVAVGASGVAVTIQASVVNDAERKKERMKTPEAWFKEAYDAAGGAQQVPGSISGRAVHSQAGVKPAAPCSAQAGAYAACGTHPWAYM